MTEDEHRRVHQRLHRALDQLLADWARHAGFPVFERTVGDLVDWSLRQTVKPEPAPGTVHDITGTLVN